MVVWGLICRLWCGALVAIRGWWSWPLVTVCVWWVWGLIRRSWFGALCAVHGLGPWSPFVSGGTRLWSSLVGDLVGAGCLSWMVLLGTCCFSWVGMLGPCGWWWALVAPLCLFVGCGLCRRCVCWWGDCCVCWSGGCCISSFCCGCTLWQLSHVLWFSKVIWDKARMGGYSPWSPKVDNEKQSLFVVWLPHRSWRNGTWMFLGACGCPPPYVGTGGHF